MAIQGCPIAKNASILQSLKGHKSDVNCCDFAPNFTLITGSSDKTVRIWDWVKGTGYVERQTSPLRCHKYQVTCVQVSPHGSMMASASVDGTALLWNLHSLTRLYTMTQVNGDPIRVFRFSPDCTLLVTAGDNGAICVWDLVHKILLKTLFEHEGTAQGLSFTPDSHLLITACSLEVVKVWHVPDLIDTTSDSVCAPLARLDNIHDMGVFAIDVCRHVIFDGATRQYNLATGGCNNAVKVWTVTSTMVRNDKTTRRINVATVLGDILEGHNSSVTCVRYDNSGRYLATSSLDKSVKVWTTDDYTCLATLYGHNRYVNCVGFSRDSTMLVSGSTGSNDKLAVVWDLTGRVTADSELFHASVSASAVECRMSETAGWNDNECHLLEKIDNFEAGVNSCCFHGKDLLAAGSGDKLIRLFRIPEDGAAEEINCSPLEGHTYAINHVEFCKDGSKLASSSLDGCTFIWNPQTGERLLSIPKNGLSIKVCRFLYKANWIVTGGDDEKAVIWDIEAVKKVSTLEGHLDTVTSLCVTSDDQILATGSGNADFRVWLLESVRCLCVREDAHAGGVQDCDFSENPQPIPNAAAEGQIYLLATCGNDGMVKLWKLSLQTDNFDGAEVRLWRPLQGHGGHVTSVRFSPAAGEVVCSAGTDRQVRLWSVLGGHCLHVLDHDSMVTCCSFNSDCSVLSAGCLDRTVWIWKLPRELVFQTVFAVKFRKTKRITDWTTADVVKWLVENNLSEIRENVINSKLDGVKLMSLSEDQVCCGLDLDEETTGKLTKELKWLKMTDCHALRSWQAVPDEFLCPITHDVIRDPVTCSDGFTYERNAITEWLMAGKFTSPMTNEILRSTDFEPNLRLRDSIRDFLDSSH